MTVSCKSIEIYCSIVNSFLLQTTFLGFTMNKAIIFGLTIDCCRCRIHLPTCLCLRRRKNIVSDTRVIVNKLLEYTKSFRRYCFACRDSLFVSRLNNNRIEIFGAIKRQTLFTVALTRPFDEIIGFFFSQRTVTAFFGDFSSLLVLTTERLRKKISCYEIYFAFVLHNEFLIILCICEPYKPDRDCIN